MFENRQSKYSKTQCSNYVHLFYNYPDKWFLMKVDIKKTLEKECTYLYQML